MAITINKSKKFEILSLEGTGVPAPTEGVKGTKYTDTSTNTQYEKIDDNRWIVVQKNDINLSSRYVNNISELRTIEDVNVGETILCNGFLYYSIVDNGEVDDGGSIIKSNNKVYKLDEKITLVDVSIFEIEGDNNLIDVNKIKNLLNYCAKNNLTSYWSDGTYVFPYDFQHEILIGNVNLQGQSDDKTIFTSNVGDVNSVKKPSKIDLKKDPSLYSNGIYFVFWTQINNDNSNGYHTSYPSGLATGDFVEINNGTATKKTLSEVKALNYVTYLDLNGTEPTIDGLYECNLGNFISGGSFPNTGINWSPNIEIGTVLATTSNSVTVSNRQSTFKADKIFIGQDVTKKIGNVFVVASGDRIVFDAPLDNTPVVGDVIYATQRVTWGSMLKKTGTNWERYNKACGIQFHKDLNVEYIHFSDIAFFLFDFMGKTHKDKMINVKNNRFKDIRRVFASDRMQGGYGVNAVYWQTEPIQLKTIEDNENYSFESIKINNNVFENIGESVLWASPSFKSFEFKSNKIINSDNIAGIVNLLINPTIAGSQQFYTQNSSAVIKDNVVKDCVTLNYVNTNVVRSLFRVMGNTYFDNNKVINSNGKLVYLAGSKSIVSNNYYEGNIDLESDAAQTSVIFFKIKGSKNPNIIENNKISRTIGSFLSVNFPQDFVVRNNTFQSKHYFEYCFSLSTGLDIDTSYKVLSLLKFQELSINYDDNIAKDDVVFFSKINNRWEKKIYSTTGGNAYEFSDEGGDIEVSLTSKNNIYKVNDIYRIQGSETPNKLHLSLINDEISVYRLFLKNNNNLSLNIKGGSIKNQIATVLAGNSIFNKLNIENVDFYINFYSNLKIRYNKDLKISGCKFLPTEEYYNDEFYNDLGIQYKASVGNVEFISTNNTSKLELINNTSKLTYARKYGIINDGFDKVYINNHTIDFESSNKFNTDKNDILLNNITNPSMVEINGVNIDKDVRPVNLVSFNDDTTTHPFVKIKGINVKKGAVLNSIFDKIYNIGKLEAYINDLKLDSKAFYSNITVDETDKKFTTNELFPINTAGSKVSSSTISNKWSHSSTSITAVEDVAGSGEYGVEIKSLNNSTNRRKEFLFDNLIVGKLYKFSCEAKRGLQGTTQRIFFTNLLESYAIVPLASYNIFEKVIVPTETSILVIFYSNLNAGVGDSLIVKNISFEEEVVDNNIPLSLIDVAFEVRAVGGVYNVSTPTTLKDFKYKNIEVAGAIINFIDTTGKTSWSDYSLKDEETGLVDAILLNSSSDTFQANKIFKMNILSYDGVIVYYYFKVHE